MFKIEKTRMSKSKMSKHYLFTTRHWTYTTKASNFFFIAEEVVIKVVKPIIHPSPINHLLRAPVVKYTDRIKKNNTTVTIFG